MNTSSSVRLAAFAAVLALVGAGCPSAPTPETSTPGTTTNTNPPAHQNAENGFGKLPRPMIGRSASITSAQAGGLMTAPGIAAPMANDMAMATPAPTMIGRPLPIPYPNPKPVTVEYSVSGTLPTWDASGDVLQVTRALPDAGMASAFAQHAGLPTQALGSGSTISSVSLQWTDPQKFQWSFDVRGRMVSFWKQDQSVQPADQNKQPTLDKNAAIAAANAFLDAHGFSAVRQSGATVDDQQWNIMAEQVKDVATKSAIYPCPLPVDARVSAVAPVLPSTPEAVSGSGGGSAGSVGSAVSEPAIMPPCGWWPQIVTVFYGGTRDGKPVTDSYGNLYRANSISVTLGTYQVTGGNLQLEEQVDHANYPLISKDDAMKRLQSGDLNPIWPWGSETHTIKVHIATLELVWMRYDSWEDNNTQTYYLPAIRATGTVDRGIKGQESEPYTTIVPLVADSAFADSDTSVPPPVAIPLNTPGMMPIKDAPQPQTAPGSGPNVY